MTEPYAKAEEVWSIDRLVPYDLNAKKHETKQVKKIAASIKKHGWTSRIVVEEDGTIIAGHGRRLAAIELNQEKVPVLVLKGISKEDARVLRLADNKVAEGGYDTAMLSEELRSLVVDSSMDLTEFFDMRDLDFAIDDLGEMDFGSLTDDIAPEVEEQTTRTEKEIEAADTGDTSVTRALGFTKLTGEQGRRLTAALAELQSHMPDESPAEVLVSCLEAIIQGK